MKTYFFLFFLVMHSTLIFAQKISEENSVFSIKKLIASKDKSLILYAKLTIKDNQIPKELLLCKNLKELFLIGDIKNIDFIADCFEKLEYFGIESQSLACLPIKIHKLPKIQHVMIRGGQFRQLPASFFRLAALERVEITDTNLEELPSSVAQLNNLKILNLNRNKIKYLPGEIFQCKKLERIYASKNHISQIGEVKEINKSLSLLFLGYNKLKNLPISFNNLQVLKILAISYNDFSVMPFYLQPLNFELRQTKLDVFIEGNKLSEMQMYLLKSNKTIKYSDGILWQINKSWVFDY